MVWHSHGDADFIAHIDVGLADYFHGVILYGDGTMTVTEAISNMYDIYFEQERRCAVAEKDYDEGRLPLAGFLEECFLLIYDCAKLTGMQPSEYADEAVLVLTRHWREFLVMSQSWGWDSYPKSVA